MAHGLRQRRALSFYWITLTCEVNSGQVVTTDANTIVGRMRGRRADQRLSCRAQGRPTQGVALGQVTAYAETNEICDMPDVLKTLVIAGCVITITATGCQM